MLWGEQYISYEKSNIVYNIVFETKDNTELDDAKLEEIITKKLLRVILNTENLKENAFYNGQKELQYTYKFKVCYIKGR